jgi:hypothetical protein
MPRGRSSPTPFAVLLRPNRSQPGLITEKAVMIAHIFLFLMIAQRTKRYSLHFLFCFSIATVVANIGVEDRGGGLALLGWRTVPCGVVAGAFKLGKALGILVIFGHDIGASLGDFAVGMKVEEDSGET